MKKFFVLWTLALTLILQFGCAPKPAVSNDPNVNAINVFRRAFEIPETSLEYVDMSQSGNAPSNAMKFAKYADSDGRVFYVDTASLRVIEMDARALLGSIPSNAPSYSKDELEKRVKGLVTTYIPNFDLLTKDLVYEPGGKIDNFFFRWSKPIAQGDFNPAFAQIGIHASGFIFEYFNTLSLR